MTAQRITATEKPIGIAILAMGGQGGGVLSDWIVGMAEAKGWAVQATSVPGVAQRTGATIYYVELMPQGSGPRPVLALMPTPGDVDIVLAAEFMEAGRSVLRGLVTPDRTTLIASTHRSYAVAEKERPGDGRSDSGAVFDAAGIAAKRTIAFDMFRIAETNGTVISSSLFGALAGARVLPFSDEDFEAAIGGGRGAEASLRAFRATRDRTLSDAEPETATELTPAAEIPAKAGHPALDALLDRMRSTLPSPVHMMAYAGLKRLVSFQDVAYAGEYLDRLAQLTTLDVAHGGATRGHAFGIEAAKYLAVAMSYDDVIRVADLKTRASRFARVRSEVAVKKDQILYTTEYMHPRMAEVIGAMPTRLGLWMEARPALVAKLDRLVNKGRRVKTDTIGWFLVLYVLGGMKRWRRGMLRHSQEMQHIRSWLGRATATITEDYDLAVEVLRCQRLVKGYSETHLRGSDKFAKVIGALDIIRGKPDAAGWMRRLHQAALADEEGKVLDGALRTLRTAWPDAA